MKLDSTRMVHAYWDKQRGTRRAPERAEIEPGDIRHALSDTFMLAADFVDESRFRLAGTRVCALFGREIKGESFVSLWNEASRATVVALLNALDRESYCAYAGLTGRTADGLTVDLELLLMPIAHSGHARIRALGVLAPIVPPFWIGSRAVTELDLGTVFHIGADMETIIAPKLVPATETTRLRHGFVVYSGGRGAPPSEASE
jgi:hypothetical protein